MLPGEFSRPWIIDGGHAPVILSAPGKGRSYAEVTNCFARDNRRIPCADSVCSMSAAIPATTDRSQRRTTMNDDLNEDIMLGAEAMVVLP